ncbi:GNAT family N-acetyltransferase [Streptomyces luteogriseus]|uniref:GNAT family N-acetyltransferase n=1 Tax=Streptomyces TaxID=1883 RepID=UPI001F3777FC|nr:GNAT family N-acetyltransferase [Streptomyces sp. NRRL S-475]
MRIPHCSEENISIRPARPDELAAVAGLRWEWLVENGSQGLGEPEDFVRHFVAWAGENARTHRCTVVVRGDRVIGMAWLAVVQRVPTPRSPRRASGDVQCVYVVPEARDGGLGGRLVRAVLDGARELGPERVTVLQPAGHPRLRPQRLRGVAPAAPGAARPRVSRMILRPSGGIAGERGGVVRCWIRTGH